MKLVNLHFHGSHVLHTIWKYTGKNPHSCEICGSAVSGKANLLRHVHTHKHTEKKLYSYEGCEASFSVMSDLVKYMHTQTGEKPHSCEICRSIFSQKLNLGIYMCHDETLEENCSFDVCRSAVLVKFSETCKYTLVRT